jgi:hypothetical protein
MSNAEDRQAAPRVTTPQEAICRQAFDGVLSGLLDWQGRRIAAREAGLPQPPYPEYAGPVVEVRPMTAKEKNECTYYLERNCPLD